MMMSDAVQNLPSDSRSYSDVRLRRKSLEGLKAKLGVHAQTEHVQEEKAEAEENTFDHGSDLEPPDGGLRAWLVVVGAMASTFTTFGYVNAWGVSPRYSLLLSTLFKVIPGLSRILPAEYPKKFLTVYNVNLVFYRKRSRLQSRLESVDRFRPGLPIGRLFDLGYFHSILFISSAILIIATFCIPECKEFWHFLLCQGFATGLACGALFGPIAAVLAMWFKKRRSLALGLFATGSSLGGTVIPIAVRNLIPQVGFAWTVRIIGFILLVGLAVANLALKRRLPPSPRSNGIFNLEMFKSFKSPAFTIYCLSSFFIYLGFYTLLTYVSVTATSIGISESFSFYLVAIANASSGVGRVLAGWCGDKFGAMNILVPFTTLAGAMTCVWPFMQSKGGLIAVVVLYGWVSTIEYPRVQSLPLSLPLYVVFRPDLTELSSLYQSSKHWNKEIPDVI
ncbi:hypothetical protein D9757_011252 [Collybiopsis confluens]|uniref:MFS general substrate transporter n=1 Tax=Collybiopsis confluens TaxID=2823264 RepID=A0A8H5GMM2_9AGAR|nr:hypothetical protein D9757_011252 [Collybiopsis confluens]